MRNNTRICLILYKTIRLIENSTAMDKFINEWRVFFNYIKDYYEWTTLNGELIMVWKGSGSDLNYVYMRVYVYVCIVVCPFVGLVLLFSIQQWRRDLCCVCNGNHDLGLSYWIVILAHINVLRKTFAIVKSNYEVDYRLVGNTIRLSSVHYQMVYTEGTIRTPTRR